MPPEKHNLENGQVRVEIEGRSYVFNARSILKDNAGELSIVHVRNGLYSILHNGKSLSAVVSRLDTYRIVFTVGDRTIPLQLIDHRQQLLEEYAVQEDAGLHDGQIRAPMPGLVLKVQVQEGASVSRNDPILVLEAMKMENEIRSPGDGVVSAVLVSPGQAVLKNATLVEISPVRTNA